MRPSLALAKLTLAAVALAQGFDVLSTNRALAHPGTHESNPVIAASMAVFGPYWWIEKAALACLFLVIAYRMTNITRRTYVLLGIIAKIYLIVVVSNFLR
jgi:hypothetical protein